MVRPLRLFLSVHSVYKISRSRPENIDRGGHDVAQNMGHYCVIITFLLLLLCIFLTSVKEARSGNVGGRVVLRRGRDSGGARTTSYCTRQRQTMTTTMILSYSRFKLDVFTII